MPDITEAGKDPIDRELVGVQEVDAARELSEAEHSYLDESVGIERDSRTEEVGAKAPTRAEQEWIESFGKVNGMEDGEFDIDGLLAKGVAVEEDTRVD